jgi:dockerin type I repeat protein
VTHEPQLTITKDAEFPTIDGTDAGKLFSGGFKKTEVVDPAKNNGKEGFVSAVVLSLTEAINLDPSKSQSIARSKYTLEGGLTKTDFPIDIMYMDGLRGIGQPVPNVITVAGDTKTANRIINLQIREGEITPPGDKRFRRGDANDDGKVNIADPIWIINELVRQGPPTECKSAADANDDGRVDLSDSMYLIAWRFQGGPAPPAPGVTNCGPDPTDDTLPCPENSASTCPAP